MERSELYRCNLEDVWRRQIGKLHPTRFARKIGGCEDLIKRLELYGSLDGHESCVNTIHFNPSGDLLVSGSDDKEIVIWDWAAKTKKLSYCSGHSSNVFQARIMPFSDDRSIVSCAADGQVLASLILDLFARLPFVALEVHPAFSFCEKALKVMSAIQEDTRELGNRSASC